MTKEVKRSYLEINSLHDLKEGEIPSKDYIVNLIKPTDFQLNKFFYKNIGKKHKWVDRLIWTEEQWIKYVSNKNVKTFVLKHDKELAGYFEQIFNTEKNEYEICLLYTSPSPRD